MKTPEIIVPPTKSRILVSNAILPKWIILDRDDMWRWLNILLGRCLVSCGVKVQITVGEDDEWLHVWGRPVGTGRVPENGGNEE